MEIKKKRIFVTGDVIEDIYIFGEVSLSKELIVPVFKEQNRRIFPGGVGNFLINLCNENDSLKNKNEIHYVGRMTRLHEPFFKKKCSCLFTESLVSVKERFVTSNPYSEVFHIIKDCNSPCTILEFQKIKKFINSQDKYDVALICDNGRGWVTTELVDLVRRKCNLLIIDPKPSKLNRFNKYIPADIITPNEFELEDFIKFYKEPVELLEDKLISLASMKYGGQIVINTRASNGCIVCDLSKKPNIQSFPPEKIYHLIDPTGAGDVFLAVFIISYLQNENLAEAVSRANLAAGKSTQFPFTYQGLSKFL